MALGQTWWHAWDKQGRESLVKEPELIYQIFKTRNRDLLGRIFSKKLVSIFQETNKKRNDWMGHTGIVSERNAAMRDESLAQKMQAVREIFELVWEEYELLLPGDGRFADGVFEYQVKKSPWNPDSIFNG